MQTPNRGAAESGVAEDVFDNALTGFRIVARFARKAAAFEMIFLLFPAAQNVTIPLPSKVDPHRC